LGTESKLKVMLIGGRAQLRRQIKDHLFEVDGLDVAEVPFISETVYDSVNRYIPDLILLDVDADPEREKTLLQRIKAEHPHIGIVVMGELSLLNPKMSVEFCRLGAFSAIKKPEEQTEDNITAFFRNSIFPVIDHFLWKKYGYRGPEGGNKSKHYIDITKQYGPELQKNVEFRGILKKQYVPHRFDVIVVGISTGGPPALHKFLSNLPADLGVPILVVQHMPTFFTKVLAGNINTYSNLPVVEATDNELITKNKIYLAPGGTHMIARNRAGLHRIALIDTPPVNACKPSVDVLFESIVESYRENVLAIVMTGMGTDGVKGVQRLHTIPCYVITQSKESCVVYGMPAAVDKAELSNESVHVNYLAARVTQIIKQGVRNT